MQTPRLGSGRLAEPALAVYLAPFAADRRVLWIGSRHGGAPALLAAAGAEVLVAQPAEPAMAREGVDGRLRWRRWEPGTLPLRQGERFDLVVGVPPLPEGDIEALEAALEPRGLLVVSPSDDESVASLHRRLQHRFPRVAVLGEAPFAAVALARLGEPPDDDVVIDGRLLEGVPRQPPNRLYVVAGAHWPDELPAYGLVAVPPDPEAGRSKGAEPPLEEDGTQRTPPPVRSPKQQVPPAQHLPAEETDAPPDDPVDREVARLESLLRERAEEIRRLRRESERRSRLARDLTERIRELAERMAPTSPPSSPETLPEVARSALERALDAESRLEAARFENDELRARLTELLDEGVAHRLARLEDEVRGWRARAAELAELHETAQGRLLLLEADLRERSDTIRTLQRDLQLVQERFEAELARTHAREAAGEHQEAALHALRGEVEGTRLRLRDREAALRDARRRVEALERALSARDEQLSERERVLQERAALVTRLQIELADEERRTEALSRRVRQLEEEVRGLREAVVEAAERGEDVTSTQRVALEQQLERAEAERAAGQERLQEMERTLQRAEAAARRARQDMEAAERERDRLRAERGALEATRVALEQQLEQARAAQQRAEQEQGYLEERLRRGEEERRELKVRLEALGAQLERSRQEAEQARREALSPQHVQALERDLAEARTERDRLRTRLDEQRRVEAEQRRRLREAQRDIEALQHRLEQARTDRDALRRTLEQLRVELADVMGAQGGRRGHHITAVGMEAPGEEREEELRRRAEALERDLRDQRTLVETLTAQLEERDRRLRTMQRRADVRGAATTDAPGEEALRRELLAVQSRLARLQEELELEREARRAAESASTAGGIPSPERLGARQAARGALSTVEELLARARARGDEEDARRLASVLEQLAQI